MEKFWIYIKQQKTDHQGISFDFIDNLQLDLNSLSVIFSAFENTDLS
jgi:hypothetical protein